MAVLVLIIPLICGAFLIPPITAIRLKRNAASHPLSEMAAFLTIKPFITTPLYMGIIGDRFSNSAEFQEALRVGVYSILPGVIITAVTVYVSWEHFTGPYQADARKLIILDCLRWGNSLLMTFFMLLQGSDELIGGLYIAIVLIAIAMPIIFAFTADAICAKSSPQITTTPESE